MSITIETLLSCDGGDDCPLGAGPWDDGDNRCDTGRMQRESVKILGWIQRGRKDYCPDCAKRLGYAKEQK